MPPQIPLVPREVLFGNPERFSPRISPDGRRLAWLAPHEGVLNVWLRTVGADDDRVVTDDDDRGIRQFFWGPDNRRILYLQDRGGDENWRLYDVELETGQQRDLTPFEGVQARVEHVDKHFPDRILVCLNRENPELHDVFELSLASGELTKVVDNTGYVGFVADGRFDVRAAVAPTEDGGMEISVRDTTDAPWRTILAVGQEDALTTHPLAFSEDGRRLLALSSAGADTSRLVWLDCADGSELLVAEDPDYDIAGARLHPDTHEPQIVLVSRERMDYLVLDASVADELERLRSLDAGDLAFAGHDDADRTWLVGFTKDDGPISYYAYDRELGESTFLFEHQPALGRYELAGMEPFSFTARDGLEIHGYLTFPPGSERSGGSLPSSTSTAAHGCGTPGATTPRRSGSRTAATSASRSTTAGRRATARRS